MAAKPAARAAIRGLARPGSIAVLSPYQSAAAI
eukprot:SAG31_NODE_44526_length_262_cov_0.944785_1_plen_32_part_01